MIPLPVVHPDLLTFASEKRPLRPSRIARLLMCPMSVLLTADSGEGNSAAQTGNLLHRAVEAFHRSRGDRVTDGLLAIGLARPDFPSGDPADATRMFRAYAADPQNTEAEVVWCEQAVRLILPADSSDPTGFPIVIQGTLDQVRRTPNGLQVWDVKSSKLPEDTQILEYAIQQATYVLAARASLDATIEPGGLILARNYFIARATTHARFTYDSSVCTMLLSALPLAVAGVRRGIPTFKPSPEACKWCDVRPFPSCTTLYKDRYDH